LLKKRNAKYTLSNALHIFFETLDILVYFASIMSFVFALKTSVEMVGINVTLASCDLISQIIDPIKLRNLSTSSSGFGAGAGGGVGKIKRGGGGIGALRAS